VLQAQFTTVRYPVLTWSQDQTLEVMNACVMMHNMIIGSEHKSPMNANVDPYECHGSLVVVDRELLTVFSDFLAMHA
jgi:hypothetical protein